MSFPVVFFHLTLKKHMIGQKDILYHFIATNE